MGERIYQQDADTNLDNTDVFAKEDASGASPTKKITWASIKSILKTYFDTLFEPLSEYGAKIAWDAVDGYSIEPGRKYIQGSALEWSSNISRSSLSLSNSTLYYVYLYDNSGTPAVEESTTPNTWNSTYNYSQKTGDASRRFLGTLSTDGSGNILKFITQLSGKTLSYLYVPGSVLNLVSSDTSTGGWTSFSMSQYIPANAQKWYGIIKLLFTSSGDDGIAGISPIDLGSGVAANASPYFNRASANAATQNKFIPPIPILCNPDTPQTAYFRTLVVVGATATSIDIVGYETEI